MLPRLRAAACHTSPIFLNSRATTDKCTSLIDQASRAKANLVVFPESFIPAFPIWSALFAPTENHGFFQRMVQESIYADGEEVHDIKEAAKKAGTVVSVGISEKVRYSTATLFNSNLIIGPDGKTLVHHRKLMPTFFEKLVWSPGDGYGLRVADTQFGKIGALICGENTNPLARYSLMAMGEQVHISAWPAIWPTRRTVSEASNDMEMAQNVNYDNVAANKIRAAAHCFEAKCFGILSAGYLSEETIKEVEHFSGDSTCIDSLRHSSRAASMFLGPTGAAHAAFTVDDESGSIKATDLLQDREGILYADLDLAECIEGKQYHDVVGGYQRLDVFNLRVDKSRREPIEAFEQSAPVQNHTMFDSERTKNNGPDCEARGNERQSSLGLSSEDAVFMKEVTLSMKKTTDSLQEDMDSLKESVESLHGDVESVAGYYSHLRRYIYDAQERSSQKSSWW